MSTGGQEEPRDAAESDAAEIVEIVIIEEVVRRAEAVPHAKLYRIRIDKREVDVREAELTGAQILGLVGKTSEGWKLYQHRPGHQPTLVEPSEIVNFRKHGVERFTTMARDTTEGTVCALRADFRLPEADEAYLNSLGLDWEAVRDAGTNWVIIHGWTLPTGYSSASVRIALLIPAMYPDAQIDMVYVSPDLSRVDGKPIGALARQVIQGEAWQRWSRHRTSVNPWRIGEDDVASHLALVDEWFRREFTVR